MKNVLENIIKFSKQKGLSYENMANDLGLSVGAYRKIELNQTHLTVERLYQIADILETNTAQLLGIEREQYNQTNKDHSTGYLQKIENFYQENKETHEKLFSSQRDTIATQNETITTLKTLIGSLQKQLSELKENP